MKKLILGISIMAIGAIGTISMIVAIILSPLNPWSYDGISGWYGCILGMDLLIPFIISIIVAITGLAIAVWGVIDKENKNDKILVWVGNTLKISITAGVILLWWENPTKNTTPGGLSPRGWLITPAVEKILIHAPEIDENGERTQEIEIYYRFIGKID